MPQSTNNILLVKPANFSYNQETSNSNSFQTISECNSHIIRNKAIAEFEQMVKMLSNKGINVTIIEDTREPIKPDAVFPNNWGSFHPDGRVILYPMLAENRRLEKRKDVIDIIGTKFHVKEILDLSTYEDKAIFLEGTGSMVLDHSNKIAYACISPRTDQNLFEYTCEKLGYQPISFHALDENNKDIYHTNVVMNIGNGYTIICLESIQNSSEKNKVVDQLTGGKKEIIEIYSEQMNSFCGNMLELQTPEGKNILAMSKTAFNALSQTQLEQIEKYCEPFPISVDTIETIGGGSVRCMISEIFLSPKTKLINSR